MAATVGDDRGIGELLLQFAIAGQRGFESLPHSSIFDLGSHLVPRLLFGNAWQARSQTGVWERGREEIENLLGCFRLGGLGLLVLAPVVLALERLDAAGRIDVLHLAGEEGMAGRAYFDRDILLRAARNEFVAAAAGHGCFDVFGMNVFLHGLSHPLLELDESL